MSAHILVVEDNPDNSTLVTWILEDEGYEVSCAETAEIGLEMLEQQSFDLVLMDISLPGMSGTDATRAIRKNPKHKGLPVLALTAHAIEGERQNILECGVDDMLTKPINDELLLATIVKYLNKASEKT